MKAALCPHQLLQSPMATHGVSWQLPQRGVGEWPQHQLCCLLADANLIHLCWIETLLPPQLRPFLKI